ncbi:cilia- and flagella-associated protein 157-like isoform X2 [Myxocyprinus asiaticus]|uniref:cilia- and flagella-associated protein 157-like isoform X2 n=1 Tax=Myxocyprinus asiaticus TaxID=70543 RepID=UPI002223C8D1|nr:cilia- and flagella-associated protein 157-like isoform X2 [Myxocyprinus asiaticus]
MPPKKNGKRSGEKSLKKESMEFEEKVAEETDKLFYRAQIRDLEERLERYQHKCDELEVQEKDLSSKIYNVEKEKKDIVLYLKRTIAQKEDDITELAEALSRHQQAQEAERESFELQLSLLRHELQEKKDKFTSENMALAGKVASLEEFSMQREKLMAECRSLEEQLQKQKEEHQAEIYNLEKKAVLDNDRLKKEMLEHVAAVAAEFRRVSDQKMPETTMRAMQENLAVTAQLKQLNDKTKELLKENDALRAREKQLKIENGIAEPLLNEMTRKNIANQKVWLQEVPKEVDSELEIIVRRNQMMQKLLAVLDSAAALGKGPALTDFMPEMASNHKPKIATDIKRPSKFPLQKSTSHLSHFKTGDLGLVPFKTHPIPSKIRHHSRGAYVTLNKSQSSEQ